MRDKITVRYKGVEVVLTGEVWDHDATGRKLARVYPPNGVCWSWDEAQMVKDAEGYSLYGSCRAVVEVKDLTATCVPEAGVPYEELVKAYEMERVK